MLTVSKLLIGSCFALLLFHIPLFASSDKGLEIFKKEIRKTCGFSGNIMAKKHTQKEWQVIYEAGKLNDELTVFCRNLKPIKGNSLVDVYDFLYNYASDSGNNALCY